MDIAYPLRYTLTGAIETTDTPVVSQAKHLINTVTGERRLFPQFGIPLDMFFSSGIPDLAATRIQIALSQIQGAKSEVKIKSYQQGTMQLVVEFETGQQLTVALNGQ